MNDHLKREHSIDARKAKSANYEYGSCSSIFSQCQRTFRHLRENHSSKKPSKCIYCPIVFVDQNSSKDHILRKHDIIQPNLDASKLNNIEFQSKQHATKKFFQSYRMDIHKQLDLLDVMESCRIEIETFLISKVKEQGSIQVQFSVLAKMINPIDETTVSCHASSFSKIVLLILSEEDFFKMVDQMISTLQVFCSSGSGFIIESLEHLDININRYKPVNGSSYLPLPATFEKNNFLLIIQNKGQIYFAYSVLAALYPLSTHKKHNPKTYKKQLNKLDLSHIEFPMSLSDIPKFEKANNLAVNVFGLEKKEKVPLFLSNSKFK